ncbi:response regulator transcription factor [Nitrospira moscoviensis]|uniref:Two component transcriptional regulator, LuxR family n=1 Tax=Nitrospira moscoviensis TaxID=42253 RepID=A0A0K2GH71_NITMO|nr:response regulator transcription factor [Nitrospira moscoviensis]ALA60286.1 Two component transcriptional regulator, LuxR family [Nitrospira moscoviensis]
MTAIRVLLADDHAVLRTGLAMLLNAQPDLEVVGEAGDGDEAAALAREIEPDVVIMDLTMGRHSGLEAIAAIRQAQPAVHVLVLSMHTDISYVRTALAAGATGYVAKSVADAELLIAVRAVAKGRTFVDLAVTDGALREEAMGLLTGQGDEPSAPLHRLSRREREVLLRVAQGFTNAQVAEELGLSVKSVETYRARLLRETRLAHPR